ncbi:hypothetical protein HanRHA438_Chr11g0531181 [Helianthus annuus]|nr:hypothetical protein HanRHA438_Chr11g0531181 [Helianthus annuus]
MSHTHEIFFPHPYPTQYPSDIRYTHPKCIGFRVYPSGSGIFTIPMPLNPKN